MIYKLGKKPAKFDKRTIPLKKVLKVLPPMPNEFSVDSKFSFQIPLRMFANDEYGDCVIAGRANHLLRFEAFEQGKAIQIKDKDVTDEYFSESGGIDSGLVMLDSLNRWRQDGWRIGARKIACIRYNGTVYDIYAFAQIDHEDFEQMKASIYFLLGCYAGIQVPQSALDQFDAGQVWEDVGDKRIRGGHCIYLSIYDDNKGLLGCLTWGKIQMMTRKFWMRYCDEAYAIVDNKDRFVENSPVDVEKLDSILDEITK